MLGTVQKYSRKDLGIVHKTGRALAPEAWTAAIIFTSERDARGPPKSELASLLSSMLRIVFRIPTILDDQNEIEKRDPVDRAF